MDARDLVIRWLEEPVEAACVLCKSKKLKKFYKGPVVSLVSGELVCPMCAATYQELRYDEPLLNRVDKCAGCAHTYQVKSDPKRK